MSRPRRVLLPVLLVVSVAAVVALWLHGADYYLTDIWDRPDHPGHASLQSSGPWGHGLGIAGTLLILINLSFLARRHIVALRGLGRLPSWLDSHVVTGLLGPLLIVYHSAFDPRTTVAIVSATSLGILVFTGIVGRFIYALVPHTVAGAEMGRRDLERRLEDARRQVVEALGADDPLWAEMDRLAGPPLVLPRTKVGALFTLPVLLASGVATRWRVRQVVHALRQRPELESAAVPAQELTEIAIIQKRLYTLSVGRQLLRWWRSLHRVFAVLMILTVVIHVGVALYFGYGGGLL